jgi:hypothetical protein
VKHLHRANEAIGKGGDSGQDQFAAFTTESAHDVKAAVATSLLRYSSKHSSKVTAQYDAVKREYDALQAALEKENQMHIAKAVEKAEDKSGPAYDKVEVGHVKKVVEEATSKAKEEVDESPAVQKMERSACDKCVNACYTDDCSSWCKRKWCSEKEHAHFVAARKMREAKERAHLLAARGAPAMPN